MLEYHWLLALFLRSAVPFYLFIYFFRKRGREVEREGEKHQCVVASYMPPTGDLARIPDWELNQHPFSSQAVAQYIEPHLSLIHI